MSLKHNHALTLVELLVTAYVLLIGICGILSLFANTMTSTESAWDTTVATSHAENILEEMQNKSTLAEIISTDWDLWARGQDLKTLPEETFKVTFTNPLAEPLDIQVIDQWQRKSGINSITLRTKLTK